MIVPSTQSVRPYDAAILSRRELLRNLERRLYENEQGHYVNRLSTELIVFPSDRKPTRDRMLDEKIQRAISYASTLHDMAEFNTLQYIPAKELEAKPADAALTLGLYLYFADEASRLGKDKTFLTAMRDAHAELIPGEDFDHLNLLAKTQKALEILDFGAMPQRCLQEWHDTGTYTIGKQRHYIDANGEAHGAYAKLAQMILSAEQDQAERLNRAISYALGNRSKVEEKTEAEMLATAETNSMNHRERNARIDFGDEERIRRIKEEIEKEVPPYFIQSNRPNDMLRIIDFLPDPALEIIYREGYTCVYTNEANLQNCYPQKDVPGLSHAHNESNRKTSTGLRQRRYNMIFLCNGTGQNLPAFKNNPTLRFEMVGQTLNHEIMHMITSYLTKEEMQQLYNAVEAVGQELEARKNDLPACLRQKLHTICPADNDGGRPWMLEEAVNNQSLLYSQYVDTSNGKPRWDTRWEEVLCNIYGLMHTEFAAGKLANDPFRSEPEEFKSLKKLAEAIENAASIALDRCRKKHRLPSVAQSNGLA